MSIVKSYSLGEGDIRGDMFYIQHNSSNFTVIDCYLTQEVGRTEEIISDIQDASKGKKIRRFISTHPHEDHIAGLEILYKEWPWPNKNFYTVDNNIQFQNMSPSQAQYIKLKDECQVFIHKGLKRSYLNQDGTTDTGEEIKKSGLNFYWPDINNPKVEEILQNTTENSINNICPIFTYNVEESATFMWMGDLETDMQQEFYNKNQNSIPQVDILFAPHHGRKSGKVPTELLQELNPKIIIIGDAPSKHIHYYDTEKTITQNSSGDISFECLKNKVRIYTKNKIDNLPRKLIKETIFPPKGWNYCGTLQIITEIKQHKIFTSPEELKDFYKNQITPAVDPQI